AEREVQLVTLVGVPGIGKSRLVTELLRNAERREVEPRWLHGRCPPYGKEVALRALGEMVKARAGILETDPADVATAKLEDVLEATLGADRVWVEPHLRPLAGLQS